MTTHLISWTQTLKNPSKGRLGEGGHFNVGTHDDKRNALIGMHESLIGCTSQLIFLDGWTSCAYTYHLQSQISKTTCCDPGQRWLMMRRKVTRTQTSRNRMLRSSLLTRPLKKLPLMTVILLLKRSERNPPESLQPVLVLPGLACTRIPAVMTRKMLSLVQVRLLCLCMRIILAAHHASPAMHMPPQCNGRVPRLGTAESSVNFHQ